MVMTSLRLCLCYVICHIANCSSCNVNQAKLWEERGDELALGGSVHECIVMRSDISHACSYAPQKYHVCRSRILNTMASSSYAAYLVRIQVPRSTSICQIVRTLWISTVWPPCVRIFQELENPIPAYGAHHRPTRS